MFGFSIKCPKCYEKDNNKNIAHDVLEYNYTNIFTLKCNNCKSIFFYSDDGDKVWI